MSETKVQATKGLINVASLNQPAKQVKLATALKEALDSVPDNRANGLSIVLNPSRTSNVFSRRT